MNKDSTMSNQPANSDFFRKTIWVLGLLAGQGLFGYALVNIIRMPEVSPDAFVPKTLAPAQPEGFPENPYALVLGCSLLCLSLIIEIVNNLPFAGAYVNPEPLAQISPDVLLYLNQTASIRYLALDVAGFSLFYAAMLVYMLHYWRTKRFPSRMVIVSVLTFGASAPLLWISGGVAVALMAISVFCVSPIPVFFGKMAAAERNTSYA
jgi:hypothetical protein